MRSALCCLLVCDNLRESAVKYLPLFLLCLYLCLCLLVASLRLTPWNILVAGALVLHP